MKNITLILISLISISLCNAQISQEEFDRLKEDYPTLTPQDTILKLAFDFVNLDTIIAQNELKIRLQDIPQNNYSFPYLIPKKAYDSINSLYDNMHHLTREIENYIVKKYENKIFRRFETYIEIKLNNGEWLKVHANPIYDEYDDIFIKHYKSLNFVLLRTQWGEGNGYKLVNTETGKITRIYGMPYFSKDGTKMISIGSDLVANYSMNGIDIYNIEKGSIKKVFSIRPEYWGTNSALWIDDNSVILKNDTYKSAFQGIDDVDFMLKLTILD